MFVSKVFILITMVACMRCMKQLLINTYMMKYILFLLLFKRLKYSSIYYLFPLIIYCSFVFSFFLLNAPIFLGRQGSDDTNIKDNSDDAALAPPIWIYLTGRPHRRNIWRLACSCNLFTKKFCRCFYLFSTKACISSSQCQWQCYWSTSCPYLLYLLACFYYFYYSVLFCYYYSHQLACKN